MSTIRPLANRIVVKKNKEKYETSGGIVIISQSTDTPFSGVVVAVGPGKFNNRGEATPLDIQIGETVLFARSSGTEVKIDGDSYLILRDEEIFSVVE